MEEIIVTRYWMLGVTGVMVIYGLISLVGYLKKRASAGADGRPRR